jgi:hypothetical protein
VNAAAGNLWLILLLGIASTTQTHLAKAMERQGIETWDMIRARLRRSGDRFEGSNRKSIIYIAGLVLNHTTFLWHLLVAPLGGNTAQYTSMFGVGLLVLLAYSKWVLREPTSRQQSLGALFILSGTLVLGLEGLWRPQLDMGQMDLIATGLAVGFLLAVCLMLMVAGLRRGAPRIIGLAFGLSAGTCGSLDPFLKAVGQTAGGGHFLPGSGGGWIVLGLSFLLGETAVLITQWGFYRRARANVLVPALNSSYVAGPVLLQAFLLPGYSLVWTTGLGLVLIVAGFSLMRGFGREPHPSAAQTNLGTAPQPGSKEA